MSHRCVSGVNLPYSQLVSTVVGISIGDQEGVEGLASAKLRPSKASSVGWGGGSCPSLKGMNERALV